MQRAIVAKLILKKRAQLGYTQEDLAIMLGLSRSNIANYEAQKVGVTLEVFSKLAIALNFTRKEIDEVLFCQGLVVVDPEKHKRSKKINALKAKLKELISLREAK